MEGKRNRHQPQPPHGTGIHLGLCQWAPRMELLHSVAWTSRHPESRVIMSPMFWEMARWTPVVGFGRTRIAICMKGKEFGTFGSFVMSFLRSRDMRENLFCGCCCSSQMYFLISTCVFFSMMQIPVRHSRWSCPLIFCVKRADHCEDFLNSLFFLTWIFTLRACVFGSLSEF